MPLRHTYLLILLTLLTSCRPHDQECCKRLNLGVFSVEIPNTWNYTEQQGVDSFVGQIKGDGVHIEFDYSPMGYASSLVPTVHSFLYEQNHLWMPPCPFCEPDIIYTTGSIEGTRKAEKAKQALGNTREIIVKKFPNPQIEIKEAIDVDKALYPEADYIGLLTFEDRSISIPIALPEKITSHHIKVDTTSTYVIKTVWPKQAGKGTTGVYFKHLKKSLNFNFYAFDLSKQNQEALLKAIGTIKTSD